jgi:hypothetical protein
MKKFVVVFLKAVALVLFCLSLYASVFGIGFVLLDGGSRVIGISCAVYLVLGVAALITMSMLTSLS